MIFSKLFKKKLLATSLLEGAFEIHCHVLPDVDDGVQTLDLALDTLDKYVKLGYQGVVLTPHIMGEWPKNNRSFLTPRFEELKKQAPSELQLKLAGEYMLDHLFLGHLEKGELLTFDGKHLLVETSYMAPSPIMDQQLYETNIAGYQPILAHPERYVYMNRTHYDKLKDRGILFQLNLLSLIGAYGSGAKKKAKELLDAGYYDFVGTDTHRPKWLMNGMNRFEEKNALYTQLAPLFENSIALAQGKLK